MRFGNFYHDHEIYYYCRRPGSNFYQGQGDSGIIPIPTKYSLLKKDKAGIPDINWFSGFLIHIAYLPSGE